jgi:hypothetical protein
MTYKKNYLNKILVLCMLLVVSCEETSEPIDCVITVNQNGITFVDNKKIYWTMLHIRS